MTDLNFENFDVRIESRPRQKLRASASSAFGEAETEFRLPFSREKMELFVLKIGHSRRTARRRTTKGDIQSAEEFGAKLFESVFNGPVGECFRTSLAAAQRENKGLRIRLKLNDAPHLAEVPWEFMYDPGRRYFLSKWNATSVIRYLDVPDPPKPLKITPPLAILVVISSPSDEEYEQLNVEGEWTKLQNALAPRLGREVRLERLEHATMDSLRRRLQSSDYNVFHFVGHGAFDSSTGDGVLVMENDQGAAEEVGAQELGELLRNVSSLRLAVLNSCEGARSALTDPFSGTAQTLTLQGVPAVIAMQFEISDDASIKFADEFYHNMAQGTPVDIAVTQARLALPEREFGVEWATPVLYMRASDGRIFDVDQSTFRTSDPHPATLAPMQTTAPARDKIASPTIDPSPKVSLPVAQKDVTFRVQPLQYVDFELSVTRGATVYHVTVPGSSLGPPAKRIIPHSVVDNLHYRHEGLRKLTDALSGLRELTQNARELGIKLFETFIADAVEESYRRSFDSASSNGMGLRLLLQVATAPQVSALPWEYLCDPVGRQFLVRSRETPIVRYVSPRRRAPLRPLTQPIRLLTMTPTPKDLPPLEISEELEAIQKAVREHNGDELITIRPQVPPTLAGLQRELRRREYEIFHFSGNAYFDDASGRADVILEDDAHLQAVVDGEEFANILTGPASLRLAVLNTCDIGRVSRSDVYGGLARSLAFAGVPYVLAMQDRISDKAAIAFAQELYGALVTGYSLDSAVVQARLALVAKGSHFEWVMPVVYVSSREPFVLPT